MSFVGRIISSVQPGYRQQRWAFLSVGYPNGDIQFFPLTRRRCRVWYIVGPIPCLGILELVAVLFSYRGAVVYTFGSFLVV